jgi:hypothetical protein
MKLVKSFTILPMIISNQFSCMMILNKTSFLKKFQTMVLICNISHKNNIFLKTWKIKYLRNTFNISIKNLEVNIANASGGMLVATLTLGSRQNVKC